MTWHMMMCAALSLLLYFVFKVLSNFMTSNQNLSKLSSFECGFETMSLMRAPFSIKFFVIIVLFVVFDIELALLFPLTLSLQTSIKINSLVVLLLILFTLLVGILLEWHNGALDWNH